jgi:hypothetical protein
LYRNPPDPAGEWEPWHDDLRIVAPLFPAPVLDEYGLLPEFIGFGVLALIVITATRGRLGYQHYREAQKAEMAGAPAV